MADQLVKHWQDWAPISSPLAPNGARIDVTVECVNADGDDGHKVGQIHIAMTTTNYAVTDDVVGIVKVRLMKGDEVSDQFDLETPRNPGRGFWPPTQRTASCSVDLAVGLEFDKISVQFDNKYFVPPVAAAGAGGTVKETELALQVVLEFLGIVAAVVGAVA